MAHFFGGFGWNFQRLLEMVNLEFHFFFFRNFFSFKRQNIHGRLLLMTGTECVCCSTGTVEKRLSAGSVADLYQFYTDPDTGSEKIRYGSGSRQNFDRDPDPDKTLIEIRIQTKTIRIRIQAKKDSVPGQSGYATLPAGVSTWCQWCTRARSLWSIPPPHCQARSWAPHLEPTP